MKPGMINVDPNRPVIENNAIQIRLVTIMVHPDYSLDKAFNGRGPIRPNRNEELDQMPLPELLRDAKRRIEEDIDKGTGSTNNYRYAGFMTDAWQRAITQGLVEDPHYHAEDYIDEGRFYRGRVALALRRARMSTSVDNQ